MASINLQPDVLDLSLYAGDGVDLRMVCTDSKGDELDLSGAVDAQIRIDRLDQVDPIAVFSVNTVDAYEGVVVLSLTGDQTRALSQDPSSKQGVFSGVWDVQWTKVGAEPRTLCQGKVECVADVSR
jgi:hypothetical protein